LPELQRHLAAAWTAFEQARRGESFDLVETTDWGLLFVPWIVERDTPPAVVQLHGSIGQIDFHDPRRGEELSGLVARMIESQLLPIADELQSYSQNNASEWQRRTLREVKYIPPQWQVSPMQMGSGTSSGNALVVGRIQYWKGATVLCEALRLLGDSAPTIDWIGRDTTFGEANVSMSDHLANTYPDVWNKKIHPLGPKPPDEVAAYQSRAAFVLVPSTWDVLNFTSIEAMGSGRVVLCSEGAGAAGLISDAEDGFVFAKEDPAALADAMRRFQDLPDEERNRLGKRARLKVEAILAPVQVTEARATSYELLVQRGRPSVIQDEWLNEAVRPHEPLAEELAFLDRLPLRELSHYVGKRTLRKVTRG